FDAGVVGVAEGVPARSLELRPQMALEDGAGDGHDAHPPRLQELLRPGHLLAGEVGDVGVPQAPELHVAHAVLQRDVQRSFKVLADLVRDAAYLDQRPFSFPCFVASLPPAAPPWRSSSSRWARRV